VALFPSLAQWRGPTRNQGDGDGNNGEQADRIARYDLLIVHIAEGTYDGTITWQLNPSAKVSSHFINARDGRSAQMVDTAYRAWTQGSGNPRCLSIEQEGFTRASKHYRPGWESLTPQQVERTAQQYAALHRTHGIPLQLTSDPNGRGLGWHGMGGSAWGGHTGCPGEPIKAQLPLILARAKEIVSGEEQEMTPAQFDTLMAEIRAISNVGWASTNRLDTLMAGKSSASFQIPGEPSRRSEPNILQGTLDAIKAAAGKPAEVRLSAEDLAAIVTALTPAVAEHLAGLVGPAVRDQIRAELDNTRFSSGRS
jgi:hypothetical protein